jgi:hypothetical protein
MTGICSQKPRNIMILKDYIANAAHRKLFTARKKQGHFTALQ